MKGTQPSLDAASLSVAYSSTNGKHATERIDIPMRAFGGGYYINLLAMYKYLEIPFRQQKFLFSFSKTEFAEEIGNTMEKENKGAHRGMSRVKLGNETPYFIHSSNNHRFPPVKPEGRTWFEYISEVLYLWFMYTYFTFCCFWFPPERKKFEASATGMGSSPTGKTESLREYLQRIHLPQYFVENYLLALISSVTTCPHDTLLDFPASDVTGYKKHMHKQPHYVVEGGVFQIQNKLLEGIKIGVGRKVLSVERVSIDEKGSGHLLLRWEECNTGVIYEKRFDQVVLAVSPYAIGQIYQRLSRQMSKIPCCEAEVLVHYDEKVIEDVVDHPRSLPPVSEVHTEKQSNSAYPGVKFVQLLQSYGRILGDTDAHIIQLRTTTHPGSMVFHKSSSPWKLLNDGRSVPSVITESTHIHPPGVLLTTGAIYPVKENKVLRSSRFVRVLRTPESRDLVEGLFREKGVSLKKGYADEKSSEWAEENEEEWRNGDEGVWLCGGWCWDGMVLLEGCVRSAVKVAGELGVEAPWKVEDGWRT